MITRQSPLKILVLASLLLPSSTSSYGTPFQVTPSSTSYGPDGPWQAVNVAIGEQAKSLDLFPGGSVTFLLTQKKCSQNSVCGAAGLFDQNTSNSYVPQMPNEEYTAATWVLGLLNFSGRVDQGLDTLTLFSTADSVQPADVLNYSITLYEDLDMTIGNGVPYPPQAGQLGLSPPAGNGSFASEAEQNEILIPGDLSTQGQIPSNSFGLHYGSATVKQNLSLWLGGYDQQRLVGPVSSQAPVSNKIDLNADLEIDLFDIGIGVETGGSPFPFPSKQGLLASNNASIGNWLPVVIEPYTPFLALPNSTCSAIAANLPLTYNSILGLYIWNMAAPSYKPIITSPSYLSFTFRLSLSSGANFSINVPFSLLNLTLEPPLVPEPTPYFPCLTPDPFDTSYSLGRAFLQAAFLGANWDSNVNKWYLAQAPGPNIATQPIPVAMNTGDSVNSSSNVWADTWKGSWTPLASEGTSPTAPSQIPSPPPTSLSKGAIAGIVIGVLLGVALLSAGAALLFIRQQRRRRATIINSSSSMTTAAPFQDETPKLVSPLEDSSRPEFKHEMGGDDLHEIGEEERPLSELVASENGTGPGEGREGEGGVGELGKTETEVSPRLDLPDVSVGSDFGGDLLGGDERDERRVSAL